jgi:hypothetical protein
VLLVKDEEDQFDLSLENEEVLHRVNQKGNILQAISRKRTNWIGLILRRNCLLKHVIEGKILGRIKVIVNRGRRHKQLQNDLEKTREYWK